MYIMCGGRRGNTGGRDGEERGVLGSGFEGPGGGVFVVTGQQGNSRNIDGPLQPLTLERVIRGGSWPRTAAAG